MGRRTWTATFWQAPTAAEISIFVFVSSIIFHLVSGADTLAEGDGTGPAASLILNGFVTMSNVSRDDLIELRAREFGC
jgi:hypothetical protein